MVPAIECLGSGSFGRVKSGTIRLSGLLKPIRTLALRSIDDTCAWSASDTRLVDNDGRTIGCACIDEPKLKFGEVSVRFADFPCTHWVSTFRNGRIQGER
jgi:hypothetical protein